MSKNNEFGKMIRKARIKKNLRQSDVGRAIGRTGSFICELEKGTRGNLRNPTLIVKIAEYLDIPMGSILASSDVDDADKTPGFEKFLGVMRNRVKAKRVGTGFASLRSQINDLLSGGDLIPRDKEIVTKMQETVGEIDSALSQ